MVELFNVNVDFGFPRNQVLIDSIDPALAAFKPVINKLYDIFDRPDVHIVDKLYFNTIDGRTGCVETTLISTYDDRGDITLKEDFLTNKLNNPDIDVYVYMFSIMRIAQNNDGIKRTTLESFTVSKDGPKIYPGVCIRWLCRYNKATNA